jgi:hypothetical protein
MINIIDNKFIFRGVEYTLEGTEIIDSVYIHLNTDKGTLCFEITEVNGL